MIENNLLSKEDLERSLKESGEYWRWEALASSGKTSVDYMLSTIVDMQNRSLSASELAKQLGLEVKT